jgi:hypothetical protein
MFGASVLSNGDGLGLALPAGAEMLKLANGHRSTLEAWHRMLGWLARSEQRLCSRKLAIRALSFNHLSETGLAV